MGNPHVVIFVDDLKSIDLPATGSAIENHEAFPERTNVHFVRVDSPSEARMISWERGSGATQACGTGACAVGVPGEGELGKNTVRLFAGLRADPFFLDAVGAKETVLSGFTLSPELTLPREQPENFSDHLNVLTIVLDFDAGTVLGTYDTTLFAVNVETARRSD